MFGEERERKAYAGEHKQGSREEDGEKFQFHPIYLFNASRKISSAFKTIGLVSGGVGSTSIRRCCCCCWLTNISVGSSGSSAIFHQRSSRNMFTSWRRPPKYSSFTTIPFYRYIMRWTRSKIVMLYFFSSKKWRRRAKPQQYNHNVMILPKKAKEREGNFTQFQAENKACNCVHSVGDKKKKEKKRLQIERRMA